MRRGQSSPNQPEMEVMMDVGFKVNKKGLADTIFQQFILIKIQFPPPILSLHREGGGAN